mmetsp:Transcript_49120/g.105692  ORF Transcript_49120/g.105692 Transcript_49120/m.105692 type:complete len:235 (-) Transcript_49120:258-962(-)
MLASCVASNNEAGVRRILEKDSDALHELGPDGTSPLCAAAMWGHDNMLRLLLEAKAAPDVRNENGPRWTALHAAALQENGKACMLLLKHSADPEAADNEGVTPCDYASCSEAVWPLFAAKGCERVAKAVLVQKGVLRKASSTLESQLRTGEGDRRGVIDEYSRPGSAYVVSREFPPRPGSSVPKSMAGGSQPGNLQRGFSRSGSRPIDILEEVAEDGPSKQVDTATAGLKSLVM